MEVKGRQLKLNVWKKREREIWYRPHQKSQGPGIVRDVAGHRQKPAFASISKKKKKEPDTPLVFS
jgi:hypothetical protein